MTLDALLEETRVKTEAYRAAQERARAAAVSAVRRVEAALVAALAGEKLRGLPLLDANERGERFYGARARGKRIEGQLGERPILVVGDAGMLLMANAATPAAGATEFAARLSTDDELLIEDVEDVPRAVEEVLRRHLAVVEQKAARYAGLEDLARRLEAAIAA